jgi:hypothetical protein
MKVVFLTHWHLGDVHVSRSFIRLIMNKVRMIDPSTEFICSHQNPFNLLADIPGLIYDPELWQRMSKYDNLVKQGDHLFINLWYCQSQWRYFKPYGLTLDALYAAFDDTCKQQWGFGMADLSTDIRDFYPVIDYSKFQLEPTKKWLNKHPERKVLIETGDVLSGQMNNFNMQPLVEQLAKNHPDIAFICSKKEKTKTPNIHFTDDIVGVDRKYKTDLNEISYLSTQCEMLIGRASGVSSFCITKENFFERPLKYIVFTKFLPKYPDKYWTSDLLQARVKYSAKTIATHNVEPQKMIDLIEKNL